MNAADHLLGEHALARHGARPALVCAQRTLCYAELAAEMARAGNALRALGVRPGERVLLLMRDTPEFAAAWLGAVHAGAVAIGLNSKLAEADYRHMVAESQARLLIADEGLLAALGPLATELEREQRLVRGAAWATQTARAAPHAVAHAARADDPAFWLFSSGTTGRPKGIVHGHKSLLVAGQAQREVLGLGPGDKVFATSKLFFAYALETGLLGPIALGASTILHPDWADVEQMRAIVERHKPTAVFSVPTFYRRLLGLPAAQLAPFRDVRHFVSAGERLPQPVYEGWRAATGRDILSLYGMSETFCVIMMTPPGHAGPLRSGKPLSGVQVRLIADADEEPANGKPGVLWVKHPALSSGYANRPEATREQFRDGWFCTRDVFVRDEQGFYSHQGRSDELLKVAGQWVQPGELEEAVLGLTSVAEAACVAITDDDGFERLALFVAARGVDGQAAVAAAAAACEQKLPRHKRPKWILPVAELPRTATGKVQRFKLRELLAQGHGRKA
ncbi:MAG: benzoate-CoA ligase family protein [Betaproteobacteria bacterium]|nr:benzoate-CoA ligase family protein [Betaproteobacteria bacterium]